ncbi:F-box protein-like protein [Tanacetum coccineum]
MSDNIPFEIQTEIIKRVHDVKSLIRFRSVSKPWLSFIDSSEFIAGYRAHKTQPHSLLLSHRDTQNHCEVKYLSVHNDTFTQKQDLAPNVSDLMKQFNDLKVIGCSRGLYCLYAFKKGVLVIWNPSIRRSVGIVESVFFDLFGFAVCPVTNEPTIVNISYPWKVEIFTLSSRKWTEIECSKPRESIELRGFQVVIGSCIYRVACETIRLPDGYVRYMIVSFDLVAKEFKAVDLPDKITIPFTAPVRFILSKLKGSLVVIVPHREVKVWKMEPDCSFTQLFTINTPDSYIINIVGFRKNGELVVETIERGGQLGLPGEGESALEVYDPCSQQISKLGFSGQIGSFFINSYKETLLLLDHLDSFVYPETN